MQWTAGIRFATYAVIAATTAIIVIPRRIVAPVELVAAPPRHAFDEGVTDRRVEMRASEITEIVLTETIAHSSSRVLTIQSDGSMRRSSRWSMDGAWKRRDQAAITKDFARIAYLFVAARYDAMFEGYGLSGAGLEKLEIKSSTGIKKIVGFEQCPHELWAILQSIRMIDDYADWKETEAQPGATDNPGDAQ